MSNSAKLVLSLCQGVGGVQRVLQGGLSCRRLHGHVLNDAETSEYLLVMSHMAGTTSQPRMSSTSAKLVLGLWQGVEGLSES